MSNTTPSSPNTYYVPPRHKDEEFIEVSVEQAAEPRPLDASEVTLNRQNWERQLSEEATRLAFPSNEGTPLFFQSARAIDHPELAPLPLVMQRRDKVSESLAIMRAKEIEAQLSEITLLSRASQSLLSVLRPGTTSNDLGVLMKGYIYDESFVGGSMLPKPEKNLVRRMWEQDGEWFFTEGPAVTPRKPDRTIHYTPHYDRILMTDSHANQTDSTHQFLTPDQSENFVKLMEEYLDTVAARVYFPKQPRYRKS